MNDEIRAILVRSREDVGLAEKSKTLCRLSRVIECQGESSESSIEGK